MESERCYSALQVAEQWGISVGRVRQIFRNRSGISRLSGGRRFHIRIPQALLDQVAAERAAWRRGKRRALRSWPILLSRVSYGERTTTVTADSMFEAAIEGLRWFEIGSRGPGEIVRLPEDAALTVELGNGGRSGVCVGRVRAWERFLSGRVAVAD
jgi:hypothetical protein